MFYIHNIFQIKNERYIDEGNVLDNIIEQEGNVQQASAQDVRISTCENGSILQNILTHFINE